MWLAVMAAFLAPLTISAADAKPIRVALYDDEGAFGKGVPRVSEILGKAGDITVTMFKAADLPGALQAQDVVIFTGGSGTRQGNAIGEAGRAEVQRFVRAGGGYLGICGGAYLACSKFSWSLGLLDAQTVSSKWKRGEGQVQIEITAAGKHLITPPAERRDIRYANGPIIKPAGRTDLAPYEPLAIFRTELAENGSPVGVMVNSPAIVQGRFGQGRVIISSPHPEQTPGMESTVEQAVRWVAGRIP
jgi:putative intracellular protease/amidase